MTTSTRLGLIEDIVISIVVFLVVSLRNTDGTVIQGANSNAFLVGFFLSLDFNSSTKMLVNFDYLSFTINASSLTDGDE